MGQARYFRGSRTNADWQELESEDARRARGQGWPTFRKTVKAERGDRCEVCGVRALSPEQKKQFTRAERQFNNLHLHHIQKIRTHRHLRFERSNVVVCCQPCHVFLEAKGAV